MKLRLVPFLLIAACLSTTTAFADAPVAVVSHIKILSDKVEDVSSLAAWQNSCLKPQMSEADKALAIWQTAVKFRHHDVPAPREFMGSDPLVYDAIKLFNVYGYCTGGPAQSSLIQMARYAGLPARQMSIFRWGVPEIFYDKAWHMYDVGMINYFPKDDGNVASVDELVAAVKGWHEKHPGYHDNGNKLKAFMKDPGMKEGPALLLKCPTLQPNGSYAFNSFGWYSTMLVYDVEKPAFVYEEPFSQGYEVNNELRRGEKLTFNWANKGLHVGMLDEPRKDPDSLTAKVGVKNLYYTPKLGDLANGRIGNGVLEYKAPLNDAGNFQNAAISFENVASAEKGVALVDPAKPAEFVIDMPCSYVYLTGALNLTAAIPPGGSMAVQISDNNGMDWRDVETIKQSGEQTIDLQKWVFRRYDYRLKFKLAGAGTVLSALSIKDDFQNSQRALPALGQGDNTIAFSAGPPEGTVTIEHGPPKSKGKQLTAEDFHVVFDHINKAGVEQYGTYSPDGQSGDVTYAVATPGDLVRLRFGCVYRAKAAGDAWDLQVSFDGGKTFETAAAASGPTISDSKWITFDKVPKHTRAALVRFHGVQKNNLVLFHSRIDADYAQPHGGFAPVAATYTWEESGQEKHDAHNASAANETYKITCAGKPTMKSLTLELAPEH